MTITDVRELIKLNKKMNRYLDDIIDKLIDDEPLHHKDIEFTIYFLKELLVKRETEQAGIEASLHVLKLGGEK